VNILSKKKYIKNIGKNSTVGYSHDTGVWQMILGADDDSEFQSFWQARFRNIPGFIHYFKDLLISRACMQRRIVNAR
jgi:hypothetical protein